MNMKTDGSAIRFFFAFFSFINIVWPINQYKFFDVNKDSRKGTSSDIRPVFCKFTESNCICLPLLILKRAV